LSIQSTNITFTLHYAKQINNLYYDIIILFRELHIKYKAINKQCDPIKSRSQNVVKVNACWQWVSRSIC